jgi:hypothetical protein
MIHKKKPMQNKKDIGIKTPPSPSDPPEGYMTLEEFGARAKERLTKLLNNP